MAPCPLELQNPRSLREVPKHRAPHDCSGPQKSKGRLQGLYLWSVALPKTLIPETLMGERCARHGCCYWIPLFAYRHNECLLLVAALLRRELVKVREKPWR
jgi:hypothetical protein